nr:hypothetical protein [Tanacetum cinerariifolium]
NCDCDCVFQMIGMIRIRFLEIDDTWARVAPGSERQPDAVAGAPGAAEDALAVDEGDQAILAPIQAPQPPPAARTMP